MDSERTQPRQRLQHRTQGVVRPRTRVALLGVGLLASKRYRRRWLRRVLTIVVVTLVVLVVVRATGLAL